MEAKCRACEKPLSRQGWCPRCWDLVPMYYKREFVKLRQRNQQEGRTWLSHIASATVSVRRSLAGTNSQAPDGAAANATGEKVSN